MFWRRDDIQLDTDYIDMPGRVDKQNLPGGCSAVVPPDPMPNSEVKRRSADGSVGSPHARVGNCQASNCSKPGWRIRVVTKKFGGAVVQLVRIPACHAGGRGFESRPHRKTSETSESQRMTKPTKSMICGLCFFFLEPFWRQTNSPNRQSWVTKSLQKKRAFEIVTIFFVSRWFVVCCH